MSMQSQADKQYGQCWCTTVLQGLVLLERVRALLATAGALCLLAMSALLGRGALLRSRGIITLTAGAQI